MHSSMIFFHGAPITVSAVLSLALSVAACAPGPGTRVPPPAPGVSAAAPIAPAQPQAAPAQGAGGGALSGPAETQRIGPDTTSPAYRADVDSCYGFARARVAHDRRMERDSTAAFDAFPTGLGLNQLRGSMNEFERKNDRASLFSDCMAAKGYK